MNTRAIRKRLMKNRAHATAYLTVRVPLSIFPPPPKFTPPGPQPEGRVFETWKVGDFEIYVSNPSSGTHPENFGEELRAGYRHLKVETGPGWADGPDWFNYTWYELWKCSADDSVLVPRGSEYDQFVEDYVKYREWVAYNMHWISEAQHENPVVRLLENALLAAKTHYYAIDGDYVYFTYSVRLRCSDWFSRELSRSIKAISGLGFDVRVMKTKDPNKPSRQ